MRLTYRVHPDGRVMVLDFTVSDREPVVEKPTPARRIEVCPRCGSSRWQGDDPHGVRWNRDFTTQVDCVGRDVPMKGSP